MLNHLLTTGKSVAFSVITISSITLAAPSIAADINNFAKGNEHGTVASAFDTLPVNLNLRISQVDLIATYQTEAFLTQELDLVAAGTLATLNHLIEPRPIQVIHADIDVAILAKHNPMILTMELEAAVTYQIALNTYNAATIAAENQSIIEVAALEAATFTKMPTGETLDALRQMLGL
ncbi:MAG: hypothetical protein JKY31_04880 [Rhodobacteraceae bacterium]|nr:hypothetical protein [Paracoccaceae bacterium]